MYGCPVMPMSETIAFLYLNSLSQSTNFVKTVSISGLPSWQNEINIII